jgi:hypothetical protein
MKINGSISKLRHIRFLYQLQKLIRRSAKWIRDRHRPNISCNVEVVYQTDGTTPRLGVGLVASADVLSPEAQKILYDADAALVIVGFDASTESFDRNYAMPWPQNEFIQRFMALNAKTVVSITAGVTWKLRLGSRMFPHCCTTGIPDSRDQRRWHQDPEVQGSSALRVAEVREACPPPIILQPLAPNDSQSSEAMHRPSLRF